MFFLWTRPRRRLENLRRLFRHQRSLQLHLPLRQCNLLRHLECLRRLTIPRMRHRQTHLVLHPSHLHPRTHFLGTRPRKRLENLRRLLRHQRSLQLRLALHQCVLLRHPECLRRLIIPRMKHRQAHPMPHPSHMYPRTHFRWTLPGRCLENLRCHLVQPKYNHFRHLEARLRFPRNPPM